MSRVAHTLRRHPAYPLLVPGMLWLVVFFFVPMYYLLEMSLRAGTFETGFRLTFAWSNYSDAISTYGSQFLRSVKYAGIATVLAFASS